MVDENKMTPEEQPVRKRSFARKLGTTLKWMVSLGLMAILAVGGLVAGYVAAKVKDEPVRSRAVIEQKVNENAITGFVYFNDGSPIGQLRTDEDRRLIKYEDIPPVIIDAVLAIEDNNFYEHKGVDFNGTMRAVKQKVLKESTQTGGSTLTQQLSRRVFLNLDRTDDRKIKEILLSLRLERFLTKEEILTAYLNKVPYGNGSSGYNLFGIKAAAKGIFNIDDLNKLNLAQAAYLAGLPQLPSSYSAFTSKGTFNAAAYKRAANRKNLVLTRMLEENKITRDQYNQAMNFDLKKSLAPHKVKAYNTYPYLMMETERQASQILADLMANGKLGNDSAASDNSQEGTEKAGSDVLQEAQEQLRVGGYRIYTTIDKSVYNSMHEVADNPDNFSARSKEKGLEQTAAMMINHKTGAILGMIEGRSFQEEQMNYATQMVRQPGSTMKPIAAYLPALDEGLVQPATIMDDSPIILKDGPNGFHIPKNSNNRYKGLMTVRSALNNSTNTIALKLFNQKVGIDKAWAFAKKLGINTIEREDYQAQTGVLGGLRHGVTVEELTNAYGSIPNGGVFNDSYMIEKIVDSQGKIVYQHKPNPVQVYSSQTAYLMTDMLHTVITDGTGKLVRKEFNKYGEIPISGKTGTTQDYTDVWFEGFTPDVTLGVWVGYKDPVYKLETTKQKERARFLWAQIMNKVTDSDKELFQTKDFAKPDGITTRTVSAYSGKLPTSLTDKFVTDLFNSKFVPTDSDDGVAKAKYITYNGVNYIPRDGTPDDMLKEQTVIKRETPISDLIKQLETAFAKMKKHNSLSYYLPEDADGDMPTRIDPRQDDGRSPDAPGNIRVSYNGGRATITFNASGNSDVVGYRLYRSLNNGGFAYQNKVVLADQSKIFTSSGAPGSAAFYVTAVDVAGNESAPSATVSGAAPPPVNPSPPVTPGQGTTITVPGKIVNPDTSTGGDSSTSSPSSPPDASTPPAGLGQNSDGAAGHPEPGAGGSTPATGPASEPVTVPGTIVGPGSSPNTGGKPK
ncbi:transglycosylase domain-containing protein [Paenibacillus sp. JX-17]|uniref:Transglycosylase domain-containing protein n=1 Tax=Paenibacillus lacisoli TaxID=3064525 RepID=A0ABT9C7Q0_9BACL|nr:transglycosylase domain-containing protein [Paenibacillus sp. JX-17]MDO7905279.1 transglycosylase domain-containing protein [Paenibacillus sp. JX-17]